MGKSKKRKLLKEIEAYKRLLRVQEAEHDTQMQRMKRRLELAGTETSTMESSIGLVHVIDAEPVPVGTYIYATDALEGEKRVLMEHLVDSLMDQNIVQFIVKEDYYLGRNKKTIGAKLFVIPWEQMRIQQIRFGRKVRIKVLGEARDDIQEDEP